MALIRFHGVQKGTWDYATADEDLPKYYAFIERLADRARAFVRRRYFRADWDPTPALVEGLLIGARALGIEAAAKDRDHASLVHALFAVAPDPDLIDGRGEGNSDETNWLEFTDALRRCRRAGDKESRDQLSWQGHLLSLVGARQGQGDMVHAVDVMRLKAAIERTVASWEFREALPNPAGVADFATVRTTYPELKRLSTAIGKAQRRLVRWHTDTLAWLGEDPDKEALAREAKETVEAAKAAGLTAGMDTKRLLQLIEDFRAAKVKAALEDASRLADGASRGLVLTILGRGYDPVARLCDELRVKLDEILGVVEAELASESFKYGQDPFAEAVSSLLHELEETRSQLGRLDQP
jgi:hypothetical protein